MAAYAQNAMPASSLVPSFALAAAIGLSLMSPAVALAEPAHVLVSVPAGQAVPADHAKHVAAWRSANHASSVTLLKQFDGPEPPGLASLAIVEFPDEARYEAWRRDAAAKLAAPLRVRRADVVVHHEKRARDGAASIFVVGRYEPLVAPAAYRDYTEAYIVPNMSNQVFSGIMTRYTMYLERPESGDAGKPLSLLVTEYAGEQAFARKSEVKDAYKVALLATHPEWKRINDTKATLRNDLDETLARAVALP